MIRSFLLVTLTSAAFNCAVAADCPNYASDLATMRVADQSLREYFVDVGPVSRRLVNALGSIDRVNTRRMRVLLKQCGWPVTSKYGKEASANAWLLIQHADQDREFQREALLLLGQVVKAGEARGGDLAYLSDRIAVAEGRLQLYGTQFRGVENCKLVLAPIDSREAVNARRRAIPGMQTLEEYEKVAGAHITPPECRHAP